MTTTPKPAQSGNGPVGLDPRTTVVHAGRPDRVAGEPLNAPLVLASTFHADTAAGLAAHDGSPGAVSASRIYSRNDSTPGWEALEDAIGELEGGEAVAFGSGMAAVAAVVDTLPVGSLVALPSDCYHGVGELVGDAAAVGRFRIERYDVADTAAAIDAAGRADLLWLESPTNPMMDVADLPALCAAGRTAGALVAVDNTFATPLLQQPLALGATVSVHSATKFIGGHADLLLGLVVTADAALTAALRRRRALAGAVPGALEAFLALRGLRTLALRLDAGQAGAHILAQRLRDHPAVRRVRYPGLSDDPGHRRTVAQANGFGAVLAFEVADARTADRLCAAVRVVSAATSLGGVESTIERRSKMPGAHIPAGLLRLSVGCEAVEDLWADLSRALAAAG